MKHSLFFGWVITTVLAGALAPRRGTAAPPAETPPRPPNIVYILADDLGYGELSCFGQQRFQTPHIDRLAAEGIRLTSHYAGDTVCSPARCALMTGLDSGHGRIRANFGVGPEGEKIRVPLAAGDRTVAELLRDSGYVTACIGKWGLGEEGTSGVPWKQGFDYFYGFLDDAHAHNQFPEFLYRNSAKVALVPNYSHKHGEFADDLFTAEALRFIGAHRYGRPFFLYLPFTSPHAELTPPADALALARKRFPALTAPGAKPADLRFAAMVLRLDQHVGEIMSRLAELGLSRRTLVIFTSDNGPRRPGGKDNTYFKSAGPYRGTKDDLYEGGIRIPFVACWPGHIAPGSVSDAPSAFWDFLPTAAQLAGVPSPRGLDGVSYLPTLLGGTPPPHPPFYWEFVFKGEARQAVRLGKWKGLRIGLDHPIALYDLSSDPGEDRNVAARHPDIVRRIAAIMKQAHVDNSVYPLRPPGVRREAPAASKDR